MSRGSSAKRYYPVDFEWQGVNVCNSGIRARGDTTRNGHKPSFRVAFNRYVGGQQLLGLDAVVLNNVWLDRSMIRDRLSTLVFRAAGVPAPRRRTCGCWSAPTMSTPACTPSPRKSTRSSPPRSCARSRRIPVRVSSAERRPYGFEDPGPDQALVQQFARERAAIVRQYVSSVAPELLAARRR